MNILAINGSPTPPKESTTEIILSNFLEGSRSAGATTEVVRLSEKHIMPCDCGHRFACWVKTPGRCIHHDTDDVHEILDQITKADIVIFATPLYLESMTGKMKTFLDRTLPLVQPYIELFNGNSRHPLRTLKENIGIVLISVCGHYEISNFNALVNVFEQIAGNLHGKLVAKILRPHAMLLKYPNQLGSKYDYIINALQSAGQELVKKGSVSQETEKQIQKKLMHRSSFVQQTNSVWDIALKRKEYH